MSLRAVARSITDRFMREGLAKGAVPCNEITIGETYMYRPEGRRRGYRVRITGGRYWGTYGLSNHWTWRRVLPSGELGAEESGYGGAFRYLSGKENL